MEKEKSLMVDWLDDAAKVYLKQAIFEIHAIIYTITINLIEPI